MNANRRDCKPTTMMHADTTDLRRKEFFNERAEQWLDMWYKDPETGTYTRYEKEFERLFSLIAFQPDDSVLDLGCGSGVLVPYILDRIGSNGTLHEVDYAEKMIEVNRRLHEDPRITFVASSADKLNVPDQSFNVVICFSCFPHFHRTRETLALIGKALKPEGKLVIAHFDSSQDINDLHRKHECVMHDQLPSEANMRQLIMSVGLSVERFIDESGFYFVGAVKE